MGQYSFLSHHCTLLARLFSEKTQGIAIALASSCKAVTLCNTEDIYLKLGEFLMEFVHYPKSIPYYQGRQIKKIFFRIEPLFRLRILSPIKHPTTKRWHPNAVLFFQRWLCGKAASSLERILCGALAKRTPGKH